jgi:hypothetical protein
MMSFLELSMPAISISPSAVKTISKNNLNITANDLVSDTAKQGSIRFAKNININVANGTYKALNKVQYIADENIDIKASLTLLLFPLQQI